MQNRSKYKYNNSCEDCANDILDNLRRYCFYVILLFMKNKIIKCPTCGCTSYTKNGSSGRGNNKKPAYKCKKCGKKFTQSLTRTEKRLYSLFENVVKKEVFDNCTLKEFLQSSNVENTQVKDFYIDFETVEDFILKNNDKIKLIICSNEDKFKVIKLKKNTVNININYNAKFMRAILEDDSTWEGSKIQQLKDIFAENPKGYKEIIDLINKYYSEINN